MARIALARIGANVIVRRSGCTNAVMTIGANSGYLAVINLAYSLPTGGGMARIARHCNWHVLRRFCRCSRAIMALGAGT